MQVSRYYWKRQFSYSDIFCSKYLTAASQTARVPIDYWKLHLAYYRTMILWNGRIQFGGCKKKKIERKIRSDRKEEPRDGLRATV